MVIAIEPESANLSAFRRNFSEDLRGGRVVLVAKGLWSGSGRLPLRISPVGDSHSIVAGQTGGKEQTIELIALDTLVAALKPPRIDFIKMDIEGAEKNALQGALQTLSRFHPRLAISSYHAPGDPAEICRIVWSAWTGYMVGSKDSFQVQPGRSVPKVLFFYAGARDKGQGAGDKGQGAK
jgi:FkbM family methyltransferase